MNRSLGGLKTKAAAAALALAFGAAAGFIASRANRPEAVPTPSGHRLFASAETAARLGPVAGKVPEWAGMDVLVLSAGDTREESGFFSSSIPELAYDADFAGLPEAARNLARNLKNEISTYASMEMAGAYSFSTDKRKTDPDFCIITMPPATGDSRYYASYIAGLPYSAVGEVPGAGADWVALIMAHEAAHCRANFSSLTHASSDTRLQAEAGADQAAIASYFAAAAEGLVSAEAVPDYLRHARSVATFMAFAGRGLIHALPDMKPINEHATAAFLNTAPAETGLSPPPAIDRDLIPLYELVVRELGISGKPLAAAMNEAARNPWGIYQALKDHEEKGTFANNPGQRTYVRRFLEGAETLAPGHFGAASPAPR